MTITSSGKMLLTFASGKSMEITYEEYAELERYFNSLPFPMGYPGGLPSISVYRADKEHT